MSHEQLSFDSEEGWKHRGEEHFKPELQFVYKGLMITVSAGNLTRKQAWEMMRKWAEEDAEADETPPPDNVA